MPSEDFDGEMYDGDWDFDFYSRDAEIKLNQDFTYCVMATGLPIVDNTRYPKLVKVIRKKFADFGTIADYDGSVFVPFENDSTFGVAFIHFNDADAARAATQFTKFDKRHALKVVLLSEYQGLIEASDEYKGPVVNDIPEHPNPSVWLQDDLGRDQYVIRERHNTLVFWNDVVRTDLQGRDPMVERILPGDDRRKPRNILPNQELTEGYVSWSKLGTYLATVQHGKDIVLLCGEQLHEYRRFTHPGVLRFDTSPREKYLVTVVANEEYDGKDKSKPRCIQIWDIAERKCMTGLEGGLDLKVGRWPALQWSHDDKYFARLGVDEISVYERVGDKWELLNKQPIHIKGVEEFQWSPKQNLISFTVPERQNMPGTVQIMSIPSKEIVGKRSFQLVSDLRMRWHEMGHYLAVKVQYYAKRTKKPKNVSFEIFSVRKKNCPVDRVELPKDETGNEVTEVTSFAFEPSGSRFAIIHGQYPGSRTDVSVFQIGNQIGKKIERVAFIPKVPASHLFWSPKGNHLVIAGLGERNGVLIFYDSRRYLTVTTEDHLMCTGVGWSPCGRYIASWVTTKIGRSATKSTGLGYRIWSVHGEMLVEHSGPPVYQFEWRPRPPDVLDKKSKQALERNLGKYPAKFKKADDEIRKRTMGEKERLRLSQLQDFRSWMERLKGLREDEEKKGLWLSSEDKDEDYEIEEIELEEEIFREEVVMPPPHAHPGGAANLGPRSPNMAPMLSVR